MIARRRLALTLAFACACASQAAAQSPPAADARAAPRFELGVGAAWIGSTGFGSLGATETTPAGSRFGLFSATSELGSAIGIEARIGMRLSPLLDVSVEGSYSVPSLRTTVSSDVESGAPDVAAVDVRQFIVGGSVGVRLTRLHLWHGGVPFVEAGAGYLRQVYDTRQLAVTGQTFHAGGGGAFTLVPKKNRRPAIGLRVSARAIVRRKGVALDGGSHVAPAASASIAFRF